MARILGDLLIVTMTCIITCTYSFAQILLNNSISFVEDDYQPSNIGKNNQEIGKVVVPTVLNT